ncbi:glycosyltransferase family 4 protein [Pandoraea eparura]|uniref:glycosyltransferase family 4 protein n=1 Tax=Pandoraea eparura TaxID=2508291 RepID=UPI001C2CD7FB|nr:glycosyltransferase family 4 protein [Pandoraea eparura]
MTSAHPWDDTRIFHKQAKSLAAAGYEVHLVAAKTESKICDGVHVHGVAGARGGRLARMLGTTSRVFRAASDLRADVYHFHDPELLPWAWLFRMRGARVVYDVHEDLPRDIMTKVWIPLRLRKLTAFFFEVIENFIACRMSAVVAATPHIRDRFERAGAYAIAVCNFPRLEELVPSAPGVMPRRQVCYVGGLAPVRGLRELVEAIDKVPDAELALCGDFSDASFAAELQALPGWRKVRFHGYVGRARISQVLAESVAGLVVLKPVPSYKDALPVKMFEYMASGIPVIASDFPLWRSIVDGSGCGVCVPPDSPEAIAQAVVSLLNRPDIAKAYGLNGRRAVEQHFNWANEAVRLISLYRDVAPDRRVSAA